MKKILGAILIIMFTATVTGYSQNYKNLNSENENLTKDQNSYSIYNETPLGNPDENSENSNGRGGGLFRDSSNPDGRPGEGDGIGQETPLDNGLNVLIACSVIYGVVTFSRMKLKNK